MTTIPLIDLTDALTTSGARREKVVSEIRNAAETAGFFYVGNHGISQNLITELFSISGKFFDLPQAAKESIAMKDGIMRGYERIGAQTLDQTAHPDVKESFQCARDCEPSHPYVLKKYPPYGKNQWPERLPEFEKASMAYLQQVETLARKIMCLLARSLDLREDFFEPLYGAPSDVLRFLRYPPQPKDADSKTFGAGSHTDWGAMTLLAQDDIGGLEVQMPDGEWVPATPIANTFVVNLGDMIPRWTSGRYRSNAHRVRNIYSENQDRQSIVFFCDLDYEAVITPLGSDQENYSEQAFTVGQHMDEMYRRSYGGM